MSSAEEVIIIARLAGTTEFIRNSGLVVGSMEEMEAASDATGRSFERTGKRGLLMNQALFTVRRLMYGVSLAFIGAGVEAVRWGFSFNSAMQSARVALQPVAAGVGGVQNRLNKLFNFTKYTPFQFKDVTIAFRQMYLGMRLVGVSANEVQTTLHSVTDALSATGRTSPGALNRVAVALQHMAYQGHLTGYSVNQLARDGIPIFAALRKELGLTGEQLHTVGTLGIPTQDALRAINHYIESTPGLMNAARRQATHTVQGLFTTFKDNVSQIMGLLETSFFGRLQSRLVAMNAFFGRLNRQVRSGASASTIIGDAFGGGAEAIWKLFASDVELAWKIFTRLVSSVAHSWGLWTALYGVLLLIHGILVPINSVFNHFGGIITNLIIPALIAEYIWTRTLIVWEGIRLLLMRSTVAEGRNLTLGMYALRGAMIAYYFILGRVILLMREWWQVQSAISILMSGRARDMGYYRVLTGLEMAAFRLRGAFLALWRPFAAFLVQLVTLDAELWANPIFLIIAGVVLLVAGLVILYVKWKAFHDFVNRTVMFLWRHPLLAMFVPIIGPLITIAHLFMSIYHHLNQIYNLLRHPLRTTGNMFSLHGLEGLGMSALKMAVPFLAEGGIAARGGSVVVGDKGPELLNIPAGASVIPLGAGAGGGPTQPIQINFVVGQRVLERVMVHIINGRVSHV